MAADLATCRRQLMEALGDNSETYWNMMKLWYKQKIGKDELDTQATQCLGNNNIHFHNNFLLAILAKCQALGQTPASHPRTPQKPPQKPQLIKKNKVKRQKQSLKTNFEQRFVPADPFKDAPLMSLKDINEDCEIGLCSYDLMLPDTATIHGRLYLGAWDAGLDNVADETVSLVQFATEYLIKDILSICCAKRSAYRLRDGHFRHVVGTAYPRMHLVNSTVKWPPDERTIEKSSQPAVNNNHGKTLQQAAAEAALIVASTDDHRTSKSPVSPYDLRDALQNHRRVLPSHTVYAVNIERILSKLWHPSQEEIEQNQLHRLEAKRRYERLKQQRSLRL
ncbi:transcriptional adapter 1-like [Actinia tenebrosa]|uniref:Transcriptional adapter 1-like n=1 Tax=Actinia tenebrosa TaxID=6105 RepID=A0A6P8IU07_ACTTE|nr:transcriptional adapter 1-like [Actinia tenebrosa]